MKKYVQSKIISRHSVVADLMIVFGMMVVCTCYNLEYSRLEILNSIIPNTDVFVRGALLVMLFVVFIWMGVINGSTNRLGYLGGVFALLLLPTIGLAITAGMELVNPVMEFIDFWCKMIGQWPFLLLTGGDYHTSQPIYMGTIILLVLTFGSYMVGYKVKILLEKPRTTGLYMKK